jgi:hypothetical protein
MLCHTLSFRRANSFSSFVDKGLASERAVWLLMGLWFIKG